MATEAQVEGFERLHGVKLPEFLRRFFLEIGGMENPDSHQLRVWPISEWVRVPSHECEAMALPEPCFEFADHLIMSQVFAIHLGASNPVFITEGTTTQIAASFEDFLRAHLTDPASITRLA